MGAVIAEEAGGEFMMVEEAASKVLKNEPGEE